MFKEPLPPPFTRHQAVPNRTTLSRSRDDDLGVLQQQLNNRLHVDDAVVQSRGGYRASVRGHFPVSSGSPYHFELNQEVGNRLYRSKSDETLSNYSMRLDDRAQAALTLKRRNARHSKHIRKDFVFDTDELMEEDRANRIPEGKSASGSAGPFIEDCGRGTDPVAPTMTIPASVMEWFARNEIDGSSARSSYRAKASKHRSAAVHDL
jgi:hypothetical protein